MLKLNVTSSKNENGDDATVSVDTGSLEGGGGGKVAGSLVVGQFLQVGLVCVGGAFPFLPWPGRRLTGCWGCWGRKTLGWGPFRSACCSPHPVLCCLDSPRALWPQVQHPSRAAVAFQTSRTSSGLWTTGWQQLIQRFP